MVWTRIYVCENCSCVLDLLGTRAVRQCFRTKEQRRLFRKHKFVNLHRTVLEKWRESHEFMRSCNLKDCQTPPLLILQSVLIYRRCSVQKVLLITTEFQREKRWNDMFFSQPLWSICSVERFNTSLSDKKHRLTYLQTWKMFRRAYNFTKKYIL